MTHDHDHHAHPHIQDFEGHVKAVESDLEYFRTKRLEPRVLHFARRGIVTLYDLLRAHREVAPGPRPFAEPPPQDPEQRLRRLEDALDELIKGIAAAATQIRTAQVPIDDTRKERGDYDPFFRIAKREHQGSLEERIERLEGEITDCLLLLEAFRRALIQRGEVTEEELQERRRQLDLQGYWNGARMVARAWVDPEFKRRLLERGRQAARELDIPPGRLGKMGVAENTGTVHNVVVCTLCSCYPHDLLGDPPWWYRSDEYKERIAREPREALAEMFGLRLPQDVQIRVHDSTSDVRWMVLPRRPAGTEGLSEEELARLVTPESLVGAGQALEPWQLAEQGV